MSQQPLEYASPAPQMPPRPWGAAIWLVTWLVFDVVLVTVAFAGVTPRMERVFKDFNIDLPEVSKLWLRLARWFLNGYGLLYLWGLAAATAVIVLVFRPPRRGPDRTWAWVMLTLVVRYAWIPFAIFAVFALMLPYVSLIQSVSAPAHP